MYKGVKKGIIAGSVGCDVKNNTSHCCNNINIWNKIIHNSDYLNKRHVLNSWFILVKNDINTIFLNDWNYWSVYKDNEFINPLLIILLFITLYRFFWGSPLSLYTLFTSGL